MPVLASACLPYAAFGAVVATWQVLLAELVTRLGLGLGLLGATLSAGGALSLPVMLAAGRHADRHGTRALLVVASAAVVAGLALYAVAASPAGFVVASLVFLTGFGAFDVAVNARAVAVEAATGRRVLAAAYAAFSAGAAAAAIATGVAIAAGATPRTVFAGAAVVLVAVLAATPRPGCTRNEGSDPSLLVQPVVAGVLRDPRLRLLAAVVALAFVVQGTLEQWSAVYLRTELGLPAGAGAAGLAAFHLAMLAGRLAGVALTARVPRRVLLCAGGGLVAAGTALALATTSAGLVVAGIAVVGAASAVVVPSATSLAGEHAPTRPGAVAALLAVAGYTAALVAPGVVGGIAELSGLRTALGVVALAGLGVAALGAVLGRAPAAAAPPRPARTAGADAAA